MSAVSDVYLQVAYIAHLLIFGTYRFFWSLMPKNVCYVNTVFIDTTNNSVIYFRGDHSISAFLPFSWAPARVRVTPYALNLR
jgi:hypothetical protein